MSDRTEEAWEEYRRHRSESALRWMMDTHGGLVFAVALRRCGGRADWAQDVTQAVFRELARQAGSLPEGAAPVGWLRRCAVYKSSEILRTETRRRRREREAARELELELHLTNSGGPSHEARAAFGGEEAEASPWPELEAALERLPAADRQALRLRFYEGASLRRLGQALGVSEDTAQKRVSRTLRRLRADLARRGVRSAAGGLGMAGAAGVLSSTTPAGMAAMRIMAGGGAGTSTGAGACPAAGGGQAFFQFLALMTTKTKITLGAVGLCGLLAVPLCWQDHRIRQQDGRIAELTRRLEASGPDPGPTALTFSTGRMAAPGASGPSHADLPGDEAAALERILREPDSLRRMTAFTAFLQGMSAEEAPAMLELMLRLQRSGVRMDEEGPLFFRAWGALDGAGAVAGFRRISEKEGVEGGEDLPTLMSGWAARDPREALAWLEALPEGEYAGDRNRLAAGIAHGWSTRDPDAAGRWIATLPPSGDRDGMTDVLVQHYTSARGLEAVQDWFVNLERTETSAAFREQAFYQIVWRLAQADITQAADWLDRHAAGSDAADGTATIAVLSKWARDDGPAAAEWAVAHPLLGQPANQLTPLSGAVSNWAEHDPNAAGQWLSAKRDVPGYDAAAAAFSTVIQKADAESAYAWAGTIRNPQLRHDRRLAAARSWMANSPPENRAAVLEILEADGVALEPASGMKTTFNP